MCKAYYHGILFLVAHNRLSWLFLIAMAYSLGSIFPYTILFDFILTGSCLRGIISLRGFSTENCQKVYAFWTYVLVIDLKCSHCCDRNRSWFGCQFSQIITPCRTESLNATSMEKASLTYFIWRSLCGFKWCPRRVTYSPHCPNRCSTQ